MSASNFPPAVIAAAQASHKLYYPKGPYTSVSLAQWAIESAYGKSVSGKNNYFGIKATPAQISSGQATVRWTQEFYDGAYRKVEQWFADYPDENGSFDAHAKLLATSPLYAAAQAAKTVETYVVAMAARYATAPNYSEVILGLIKSAGLTQFDVGAAVPVASTSVATAPPAPAVPPRKVAPPEAVAEVQAKVGQLQNTPAHLTIWEKIKAALEMLEG